jgi:hypothetical protein
MKCVSTEEGKEILQEIHEGVCRNHMASRTLVSKVFRSGFYWPTALADAEALVHRCTNYQFFGKQPHIPDHNLITIPPSWLFACWGHDRAFNNCARRFHTRVGGHRQVYQVDRIQANRNAICRSSGYFHLRHLTSFWHPQYYHYRSRIQFPLALVLGFLGTQFH